MRGFLAVARLEILEKRFVFVAAAGASLIPFIYPVVRNLQDGEARDAREMAALVLGAACTALLSFVLGRSAIATDLTERRLSFYFSRPLSGAVVWSGKMGGSWLIVLVAAAIIVLPAAVASA